MTSNSLHRAIEYDPLQEGLIYRAKGIVSQGDEQFQFRGEEAQIKVVNYIRKANWDVCAYHW